MSANILLSMMPLEMGANTKQWEDFNPSESVGMPKLLDMLPSYKLCVYIV